MLALGNMYFDGQEGKLEKDAKQAEKYYNLAEKVSGFQQIIHKYKHKAVVKDYLAHKKQLDAQKQSKSSDQGTSSLNEGG